MKTTITLTILIISLSLSSFSQESSPKISQGFKYNNNFDLALAASSDQFSGALSWVHFYGIGKNKKFKVGYGLRYTGYSGSNQNYITAPAKLTTGKTGPLVFFAEPNPANYDTLFVTKAQHNSINLSINLQYALTKKAELGFNIDAIGVAFGAIQTGKFISSARPATISETQSAKPTSFNALLISDNDIGMLNSELYGRYWLTNKIGIKAGFGFLFTEYTTNNKLVLDNDRWRNKSLMAMIGLTFTPFK